MSRDDCNMNLAVEIIYYNVRKRDDNVPRQHNP
jgi:hypothetical protein